MQWPLLLLIMLLALAVLYRYAPDRTKAQWKWVSPGAFAATMLWLIGWIGFSVYVANFVSARRWTCSGVAVDRRYLG